MRAIAIFGMPVGPSEGVVGRLRGLGCSDWQCGPVELTEVVLGNGPVDVECFLETGAQTGETLFREFDLGLLAVGAAGVCVALLAGRVVLGGSEDIAFEGVHELIQGHAVCQGAGNKLGVVDPDVVRIVVLPSTFLDFS